MSSSEGDGNVTFFAHRGGEMRKSQIGDHIFGDPEAIDGIIAIKPKYVKKRYEQLMIQYIADKEHHINVLSLCEKVKHDLWIGTADLKDLYVEGDQDVVPFLSVLDNLLKQGVDVRLLHAKESGENFRADFDKYPGLWSRLERRLCPRVHFKIMIFDCATAYIGSANLTGAGMGMKGENNRNFEAGIFTDEPSLVDAAADHLDRAWQGTHCAKCKRKDFCGDRIV